MSEQLQGGWGVTERCATPPILGAGAAFGKTGSPSGTFNTFPVPFATSINITVEILQGGKPGSPSSGGFWIIVRGRSLWSAQADADAGALSFALPGSAGVQLPHTARLRTVETKDVPVAGGATHALFNSSAARGAVYLVVLQVDASGGPGFLEGCFRGMTPAGDRLKILLSSGTEDYFLGTYYFNKGGYENPVAGMTHKVTANCSDQARRARTGPGQPAGSGARRTIHTRTHTRVVHARARATPAEPGAGPVCPLQSTP